MVLSSTVPSRNFHALNRRPFRRWYSLLKRWDRLDRESIRLRVAHGDAGHPAVVALEGRREALHRAWLRFDADCANDFMFFLRRAYEHNPDTLRAMLRRIDKGELSTRPLQR